MQLHTSVLYKYTTKNCRDLWQHHSLPAVYGFHGNFILIRELIGHVFKIARERLMRIWIFQQTPPPHFCLKLVCKKGGAYLYREPMLFSAASLWHMQWLTVTTIIQCYALILPYGADDGDYDIGGVWWKSGAYSQKFGYFLMMSQ